MSALDSDERTGPREQGSRDLFHGTLSPLTPGTTLVCEAVGSPGAALWLDAGRQATAGLRSRAVWAAEGIRDATAIAAIRVYSRSLPVPHEALHVYRVELAPFHVGPLAIIEELERRFVTQQSGAADALIREYWAPTGVWHLREVLAPSLTILEEVPATSERDLYIRRWVEYNKDRERVQLL